MTRALVRALAWLVFIALGGWMSWVLGLFLGILIVAYGPNVFLH